jgi:WD40 repeat protein
MCLRQSITAAALFVLAAGARAQTSDLKSSFTCPDPVKRTRVDLHGDPLPEGAVARLGSVRLRHGYLHSGLAFSADGKSIIASDYYSGVHVWDAGDGREIRQFCESDYYCHCLAVSPDGRTLAVALGNLTVRLFDPSSGRELGSLPKDREHLDYMVFSNDGTLLATSGGNWPVRVYDVATQKLLHRVQFPDYVSALAFSPDGRVLIGGGRKGVSLRDVARGDEVRRLKSDSESGTALYSAVARQAGTIAVWGYDDASVRLFDANGEKELRRFHPDDGPAKKSPDAWGWGIRITARFAADGKTLAISRGPSRIDLFDTASGKKLHSLAADTANRASHMAFSPDGTKLASTGSDNWGGDNTVRVWDVVNGKEIQPRAGHGSPISSITMSPTGDTVATAGRDGAVHLWEGRSGKHLARLDGHGGRWPQASFSTDGLRLITWGGYGSEGALRIWNSTGKALRRHNLQEPSAYWDTVSEDGNTAASVSSMQVRFHDLATGKVTREFPDGNHRPIALSPTGDKLLGIYGTLINVADNKTLMEARGVYTHSNCVRFSADGRTLVAAMIPQGPEKSFVSNPPAEEVAVFDPIAGRELRRFGMLGEKYRAIHAITLSRDGKMIAAVRNSENNPGEQVITLWETETGAERGHFVGHRGKTHALAISADGRLVVSGGDDTAAIVWDATQPRTHDTSVRRAATTADLAARFKHLTGEHAELAYAAMWAFIHTPKEAVGFLADQTRLFEATDVQKIGKWIQDLDSSKYAERERASQELALVLDESEEHLKKARLTASSAEARRRIDLLLQAKRTGFTGKKLQTFRVIEILERIGTPEADAPTRLAVANLLKKLAAGPAQARMTREAMASVERIERRAAMSR